MEYLAVGRVLKPQGIKGEIKVEPLTHSLERFEALEKVYSDIPSKRQLNILNCRLHKGYPILKLEGIDDVDQARSLAGSYLKIPSTWREELPVDSYYIYDLVGLEVFTGDGKHLGELKEVMTLPGNDVFLVQGEGRELLIPALKQVVKKVDLEEKRLVVELLPGLGEATGREN